MAKTTGGHRIEDHFVDVTKMVETKQRKQLGNCWRPSRNTKGKYNR